MKTQIIKFLTLFLCFMLITVPTSATEVRGVLDSSSSFKPSDKDYSVAPDPFYPFIYDEEWDNKWLGKVLGENISLLKPGYLYIANLDTLEVEQAFTEAVVDFECSSEFIYAATATNLLFKLDYLGQSHTLLYTSPLGALGALEYQDYSLYFVDGSKVVLMDTRSGLYREIFEREGITGISEYKSGHLLLTDATGGQFEYDIDGNRFSGYLSEEEVEDLWDSQIANFVVPSSVQIGRILESDVFPLAFPNTYVSLPLTAYPAGSYFTTDGLPCVNHNRCKDYARTNQCDGFARYANEIYYHVPGNASSAPYSVSGDIESPYSKYDAFGSEETSLYQFFNLLEKGAYVRVSKRDAVADNTWPYTGQGSHSFVYISHDRGGAVLYEANLDGQCGVSYGYRDYETLLEHYPYFIGWVNHNQDGAVENTSDSRYHRVRCSHSGCIAYIIERHTYTSNGAMFECIFCGDVTDDPEGGIVWG